MPFKNLHFEDNQVKFTNTDTRSDFTYFINSIKCIEDNNGTVFFLKEGEKPPQKNTAEPKVDWITSYDSLRESNKIRAEIVLKNGDTLRTHIKVKTLFLDPSHFDEMSIVDKVTTINNKEKVKYFPEEINRIRFIDYKGIERIFVSNNSNLLELLLDGKIRWYRAYRLAYNGNRSSVDFIIETITNKQVILALLTNRRKKLLEITSSRPDLIPTIENMKMSNETIRDVLIKYNN